VKYLSVCAGIEAATCAWHHMGWEPVAFSEIEKFPSAVLAHHYPNVPNWGDMTRFKEWPDANIDVLVGGTPCQSFSVAGLRKGLDDPRGNLMLTYLAIAQRYRPQWLVWENVPGVLSSEGGRDFAALLRGLAELGYGWAYRVLDAQYFGVAQRRRRVFVVGHLGDWHRAAAVLFERHSLSGHPAPSRQARKGTSGSVAPGATASGWPAEVSPTLNAHFGSKQGLEDQHIAGGGDYLCQPIANCLTQRMHKGINTTLDEGQTPIVITGGVFDVAQSVAGTLGNRGLRSHTELDGHGAYIPVAIQGTVIGRSEHAGPQGSGADASGAMFTLTKTDVHAVAQPVPYDFYQITAPVNRQNRKPGDPCHTLARDNAAHATIIQPYIGGVDYENNAPGMDEATGPLLKGSPTGGGRPLPAIATAMQVRRLTPVECERLQGFPDGYTNIPWRNKPESPDGPRYQALGNSMAVPVMSWIGERINEVSKL